MTITTEEYWDCECGEDFIHPKSEEGCIECGAMAVDQPDSMLIEVLAEGLPVNNMPNYDEMNGELNLVAHLRTVYDARNKFAAAVAARDAFIESLAEQLDPLSEAIKLAKMAMEAAETAFKFEGRVHYLLRGGAETGKKLPKGAGIRVNKNILYDSSGAVAWAKEFMADLVIEIVDDKGFKDAMKSKENRGQELPECVKIKESITVTIPTKEPSW